MADRLVDQVIDVIVVWRVVCGLYIQSTWCLLQSSESCWWQECCTHHYEAAWKHHSPFTRSHTVMCSFLLKSGFFTGCTHIVGIFAHRILRRIGHLVQWKNRLRKCREFAQNSRKWCTEFAILAQNSDNPKQQCRRTDDMYYYYLRGRPRRSSNTNRLVVPQVKLSTVGSRAFAVAAPDIWNRLPPDDIAADSLSTFRGLLKRFLFCQSYPDVVYWYHPISSPVVTVPLRPL